MVRVSYDSTACLKSNNTVSVEHKVLSLSKVINSEPFMELFVNV